MIAPILILSLGQAGHETLKTLMAYLPSGVPVQAAGLSFEPLPSAADSGIPWHTLGTSIEPLTENAFTLRDIPDVASWFDAAYYANLLDVELDATGRQIGRLLFYEHMMSRGRTLEAFLHHRKQQFPDEAAGSRDHLTLQVHLLFSLDELEGTSIVLDVVNLVHYVLAENISVTLHTGLPELASQPPDDATRFSLAAGFAMLRELKRFVVSYGGASHQLYPDGSPLAQWNTRDVRHLISDFKVYAPRNRPLTQQWADVLLALLDGAGNKFLTRYEQDRLNTYYSRDYLDDRYALVAGLYEVKSAIFPREPVRTHLVDSLSHQALAQRLGSPCDERPRAEQLQMVRQHWFNALYRYDDGRPLRCPSLVATAFDNPERLSKMADGESLRHLLGITSSGVTSGDAAAGWDVATVPVADDAATYTQQVDRMLTNLYGDFTPQNKGQYRKALQAIVTELHTATGESLRVFVLQRVRASDTDGIRCVLAVLADILLPHYRKVQNRLDLLIRQKELLLRKQDIVSELRQAAGGVRRTHKFLGGLHGDVLAYQKRVDALLAPLEVYLLWEAVQDVIQHVVVCVQQMTDYLMQWRDLLWQGDGSLLARAVHHDRDFRIPAAASARLWLIDDDWLLAIRREVIARHRADLMHSLHWDMDDDGQLQLMMAALEADSEPRTLTPELRLADAYYTHWRALAEARLSRVVFSLWEDYLQPDDRMMAYQGRLQALFERRTLDWDLESEVADYYFALPDQVAYESHLQTSIVEYVKSLISKEPAIVYTTNGTRITLLTAYEQVLMTNLPDYQHMQAAYQQSSSNIQALLHVLAPEVEAIRLQTAARASLQEPVMFSGDIVTLLSHRQRIETFILLYALGLIDRRAYELHHSYVLYELDTSRHWWLPARTTGDSLYQALQTYCLDTRGVEFGFSSQNQPLPRDQVDGWIDRAIQRTLQQTDAIDFGEMQSLIQDLITHRGQRLADKARRQGYTATQILALQERLQAQLHDDLTRRERETRLLLITVAQAMLRQIRHTLQQSG